MRESTFVAEIQALRAIAIVLVVFYHAGSTIFSGGFVGVDVFFVISGYLITSLLLRELVEIGHIRLSRFYSRRIRRLVPAASVVLLATIFAAWATYGPLDFKTFTSTAITTAVYVSNFWFVHLAMDYLAADASTNPLLHTWSLSVEEQFYLVWPVLILLLYRLGSSLGSRKVLLIGLGSVCIVSFVASLYLTTSNQPLAFFGSPTRAWEFGIGGLIAVAQWSAKTVSLTGSLNSGPKLKAFLSVSGLALILIPAVQYTNATVFPGWAAAIPVMGTALIILSALDSSDSRFTTWMRTPPVQYIGNISYSLYLWHWPILIFLRQQDLGEVALLSVYFSLSFFLASATYHLVENPVRLNSVLAQRVLASFLVGGLMTVSTAGTAYFLRGLSINELSTELQQRYQRSSLDIPKIYKDGCHLSFTETELKDCIYGHVESSKTIVLFGDSHAAQWFPALENIALTKGYALVNLTKSACPSMSFLPVLEQGRRPYLECAVWRERAFERISSLKPGVVIISNHGRDEDRIAWTNAIIETFQRLKQMGVSVVLVRDTPWLPFNVPSCLSRAAWKNLELDKHCRFSVLSASEDAVYSIGKEQLKIIPGSIGIDMTEYICPGGIDCESERNGIILYHDEHHLTAEFSRSLGTVMFEKIRHTMNY